MRIIFATGNADKLREIREILGGVPEDVTVMSMKDAGVDIEIEENGDTFEENAVIKAVAVAEALEKKALTEGSADMPDEVALVCADDSGLCIDALDGAPGVMSARFLGHDTPYPEKNARILEKLADVPDEQRGARFVCAVAAVFPYSDIDKQDRHVFTGVMEGRIAHEIAGSGGFGYDPIFYLPEYGRTSAELTEEGKNAISHRGKAIRALAGYLRKIGQVADI